MLLRSLFATMLATLALPVLATPQLRDATDMWFNPSESGWGLNVIHQGDTLFATLFVYGPDGQPRWYVASSLTGSGPDYTGTLFEQTGPAFSVATFDPATVTRRAVGNMALSVNDTGAMLDYTIDNVHVTKALTRFSFLATSVGGGYIGKLYKLGALPSEPIRMTIDDDGSTVVMNTGDSTGTCTWTGTRGQNGQYTLASGTYTCGNSRAGTWSMTADAATEGLTGSMVIDGVFERMGAARSGASAMRGNGFRNEMWFVPAESGWGFNTIEQGDMSRNTLFATLFVYDAQGRPKWYVVPNLDRQDVAGDNVAHLGTMFEMTGPYFGGAFNPAAVSRRTVGFASLQTRDDGSGHLFYTIDGVPVDKPISRFTFRKEDFSGSFSGGIVTPVPGGAPTFESLILVLEDGAIFRMTTGTGTGTNCNYTAPMQQAGHVRSMEGSFTCNDGRSGSFIMSNATVTGNGFSAQFTAPGVLMGHIGGVRLGS